MKTTFNEKGQMVLVINDTLSITLEEADFEYRSHINGMQALSPNNWVACEATGSDGNHYTAWYFLSDTTDISLEDIDYANPNDITDEYNHIVYDKAE